MVCGRDCVLVCGVRRANDPSRSTYCPAIIHTTLGAVRPAIWIAIPPPKSFTTRWARHEHFHQQQNCNNHNCDGYTADLRHRGRHRVFISGEKNNEFVPCLSCGEGFSAENSSICSQTCVHTALQPAWILRCDIANPGPLVAWCSFYISCLPHHGLASSSSNSFEK